MLNAEVAKIFRQLAIYEDMENEFFRARAYQRGAEALEALAEDVKEIYRRGGLKALEEIPGIGGSLAEKIEEYLKTRRVHTQEQFKKKLPLNLEELYAVEGLGPKTIKLLWEQLKIKNLKDLERAARLGKIATVPHLGEKTQEKILRAITFVRQTGDRKLLGAVLPLARALEERFRRLPGVTEAVVAGSLRRRQETIGDIDLLVVTTKPKLAHETFIKMPEVIAVKAHGAGRSEVRLSLGMDADLRVVPPESFGAALQYFTGDKQHNVELRKIAIAKGLKLNEYGLFREKKLIASRTEAEVYRALGLDLIPPEVRTAAGELAAAKNHALPRLLPYGSVRGDLQIQTKWTDGVSSLEEMARAALALGREYIAITDHTRTLAMTGGLDERGLARQAKEIDALNTKVVQGKFGDKNKKFRVLKGAEVNILKDGSLDIDDAALAKLDIVAAAVHTNMKMPRPEMTRRIIKALQHPRLHILFHPTGRLINKRPPYEVDIREVIKAAKKYRVALEVNAFPDRLDLKDEHVRLAVAAGVKLVINTDAHAPEHLRYLEFGEATARRGWATRGDVLNTLPLNKLLEVFRKKTIIG